MNKFRFAFVLGFSVAIHAQGQAGDHLAAAAPARPTAVPKTREGLEKAIESQKQNIDQKAADIATFESMYQKAQVDVKSGEVTLAFDENMQTLSVAGMLGAGALAITGAGLERMSPNQRARWAEKIRAEAGPLLKNKRAPFLVTLAGLGTILVAGSAHVLIPVKQNADARKLVFQQKDFAFAQAQLAQARTDLEARQEFLRELVLAQQSLDGATFANDDRKEE